MLLCFRRMLGFALLVHLPTAHAGILPPPGAPDPVHTLVAELQGNYVGLPPQDDPRFGFSVALYGDTLAVGAPGTLVAAGEPAVIRERGTVFIFRRHPVNDSWQYEQRLFFGAGGAGECGHAVALSEFSLLVGCPFFTNSGPENARGRAVFFSRNNSSAPFDDPVSFIDDSTQTGALCGSSVTLIDAAPGTDSVLPMAAVGCPDRRDFPGGNIGLVGGVDIYRNVLGQWALATSLNGPSTSFTAFGHSLSLNRAGPNPGQTLLLAVGIPSTGNSVGSVRVYAMGATVGDWSQEHLLTGPGSGSRFGHSVHMRVGRLAVGAPERRVANPLTNPPNQPTATGSLTITTRVCTMQGSCSWSGIIDEIVAPLLPLPSSAAQNRMGHAVHALTPNRIIAGAPLYPFGSFIGQARHYELDGGDWILNEDEPFNPVGPAPATSEFGAAISGDDAWLAIGAPGYPQENPGRVFVYAYDYDDTIFANDFEFD